MQKLKDPSFVKMIEHYTKNHTDFKKVGICEIAKGYRAAVAKKTI